MKRLILILSFLALLIPCKAQEFGVYHPMYFIGGIPLKGPVDKTTAGLKFQVGTSIPLWRNIGDKEGLDFTFVYNQVSVWDLFDESSPFKENTYIPGWYLNIPIERDRLLVGIEHRSNGRPMRGSDNDTFSRSVNYLFGEYGAYLPNGLVFKANVRAGIGWYDEELTQEIFWRFLGYADFTAGYRRDNLELSLKATPTFGPFYLSVEAAAAYNLGFCSVFAQFNRGYGEALCDWVRGYRPTPYLRFGILFGRLL